MHSHTNTNYLPFRYHCTNGINSNTQAPEVIIPHTMSSGKTVEFKAYDGTKLVGDLYSAGEKKPCIIATNGVSGPPRSFPCPHQPSHVPTPKDMEASR